MQSGSDNETAGLMADRVASAGKDCERIDANARLVLASE